MNSSQPVSQSLLFGIDASSAQQRVDWSAVDSVTAFGWEKVTQGTDYVNPYWPGSDGAKVQMRERQRLTGFTPGAFLFLEQGNGAAQADYFAQHAGDLTGFGLMIDCEPWPAIRSFPTHADLATCAARLRVLFPGKPLGGYLPPWYWDGQDTTVVDWLWPSIYVFGIGSPASLYARVPASWWSPYGGRSPSLLQFTSSALVSGVAGAVDCSAFRGTPQQYRSLVVAGTTPTPPPPPNDWQVQMMHALPTLQQGTTDHMAVRRVQALLRPAGVPVAEDGVFGPATSAAVKRVQAAHGLTADGVVGEHTWAVLVTGSDL